MALTRGLLRCRVFQQSFRVTGSTCAEGTLLTQRNKPSLNFTTTVPRKYLHVSSGYFAKLRVPVDDVYLEDLYDPVVYDLEKAVETMKRYMKLDLEDDNSIVRLKLDLHLAPKGGKGKHQSFWDIIEPIHKFNHTNRVCAFVDDADLIKQCLELGAFYAGGHDVIQKVLFGKNKCDAFVTTNEFHLANMKKNLELQKFLGKLAPKKNRGLGDDIVEELLKVRDGTIIHNQTGDNWKTTIIVGVIGQPAAHIQENIIQAMDAVKEQQNPKHPPIIKAASINCHDENLSFNVKEEEV